MADVRFTKLKHTDPKALQETIDRYFESVDAAPPVAVAVGKSVIAKKLPPSPAGLARCLGITTQTLGRYMRGEVKCDGMKARDVEAVMSILTDARMRIEEEIQTRGLIGDLDTATVKQTLGMLGYNKSLDAPDGEVDSSIRVVFESSDPNAIEKWGR